MDCWIRFAQSPFGMSDKLASNDYTKHCSPTVYLTQHCMASSYLNCNTSRSRQNGRYFADDISTCNFINETFCTSIRISLRFVPNGPRGKSALAQVMVCRWAGGSQLTEPIPTKFSLHPLLQCHAFVEQCMYFLHAKPWIPGGRISIFMAVIH